ncbi:MAG: hypothetical protein AAF889_01965 [Cyanobacteria bacterium P01_D01_bin.73]
MDSPGTHSHSSDDSWIERSDFDDVYRQACGGSIAAIVQVLNHRYADRGLRTRAMLSGSTLKLLCEAPEAELLDQEQTVDRVWQSLENIGPKGISRVHVYGRLVREQQLLWLDAIERNPEHLLWSHQGKLKRSHWFRWVWRDLTQQQPKTELPGISRTERWSSGTEKQSSTQPLVLGAVGGAIASLLLLGGIAWYMGWINPLGSDTAQSPQPAPSPATTPSTDPFAQAIRIAEAASLSGQKASTREDWENLSQQWRKASDLMGQVKPDDSRYQTAQDRKGAYLQNSIVTRQQAEKISPTP